MIASVPEAEAQTRIITIAADATSVTEGATVTYTLTADKAPDSNSGNLSVRVSVHNGAVNGDGIVRIGSDDDFLASGEAGTYTFMIPRGTTTATFTADTVDDNIDEADGRISAIVLAGSKYARQSQYIATTHVMDNDVPEIAIASVATASEGMRLSFNLTANIAPAANLDVKVGVQDVDDFLAPDEEGERTVRFPAGQTSVAFTVNTDNDDMDEANQIVRATLRAGDGYIVSSASGVADIALVDNDDPAISFGHATYHVPETETLAIPVNIFRTQSSATTVTVGCSHGTAGGSDYTCPASVTIPANAASATFTLSALQDLISEGDESFTVTLGSPPAGVRRHPHATATVTIVDNGSPQSCTNCMWIRSGSDITEGSLAVFTLRAHPPPAADLKVRLAVLDATESPISDFLRHREERARTATLPAGQRSASFTVPTVNDGTYEPDGTVKVRLLNVESGGVHRWRGPTTIPVTVRDDDTAPAPHRPPSVSASTRSRNALAHRAVPPGGNAYFCFYVEGGRVPSTMPSHFTVGYEVTSSSGRSLELGSGGLGFSSSGTLQFCLNFFTGSDWGGETLTARVLPAVGRSYGTGRGIPTYVVGSTPTATITVQPALGLSPPEQAPAVTISPDRTSVTEGGAVTFTVTAVPAPARDLAVYVLAAEEMGAGDDMVSSAHFGAVTIPADRISATWTVTTMSDDDDLADGTVAGRIVPVDDYVPGAPSSTKVALLDDDGPGTRDEGDENGDDEGKDEEDDEGGPVVTDPATPVEVRLAVTPNPVTEGSAATVTATLSAALDRSVAIPLVVTAGSAEAEDFASPQTVTVRAGETSGATALTTADDGDEDDETLIVSLGSPLPTGLRAGTPASVEVAIVEVAIDDPGEAPQPPAGPQPPPGPTPPGPTPPPAGNAMRAEFTTAPRCDRDPCRVWTGEPVLFTDLSPGTVRSRRWELGDGATSTARSLSHAWRTPGFHEVSLTVSDGDRESATTRVFLVEADQPQGKCEADEHTRCLRDSRFAVTATWSAGNSDDGEAGNATVVPAGTNDSALFSFYDPANWEVLVKVLDGCTLNGRVWVFAASTTNLESVVRIEDTVTGEVREYRNEPGAAAAAVTDNDAFETACATTSSH